jgi:hypothetical protein
MFRFNYFIIKQKKNKTLNDTGFLGQNQKIASQDNQYRRILNVFLIEDSFSIETKKNQISDWVKVKYSSNDLK